MLAVNDEPWMVVRTQPRRENWACENMIRQGAETYVPKILTHKLSTDRNDPRLIEQIKCLFPSYAFVRTRAGQWWFLLGTFGVSSLIMQGRMPAILSNKSILAIRDRESSDGLIRLPQENDPRQRFKLGDPVRVKDGCYEGYEGIWDGMGPQDRNRILLDFLGRKTRVLIPQALLEPALDRQQGI